jgi:hypothetical protein
MRPSTLFFLVFLMVPLFPGVSGGQSPGGSARMPHSDHRPKHGGIFFMSLDYKHHLEGVLLSPGIFRVYLYDAYTRPLPAQKVRQARGTVQLGESEDAPKLPLTLARDGRTLEVALPRGTKLPLTIALLLHFPDTKPEAKEEIFDFHFSHYGSVTLPAHHPGSVNHSGRDEHMDHGKM